jgi:hypothetical protein
VNIQIYVALCWQVCSPICQRMLWCQDWLRRKLAVSMGCLGVALCWNSIEYRCWDRTDCHSFRLEGKTSVIIIILTWCCAWNVVWGPKTLFLIAQLPGGVLWLQTETATSSKFYTPCYCTGTTRHLYTNGECLFYVKFTAIVTLNYRSHWLMYHYSSVRLCIIVICW